MNTVNERIHCAKFVRNKPNVSVGKIFKIVLISFNFYVIIFPMIKDAVLHLDKSLNSLKGQFVPVFVENGQVIPDNLFLNVVILFSILRSYIHYHHSE